MENNRLSMENGKLRRLIDAYRLKWLEMENNGWQTPVYGDLFEAFEQVPSNYYGIGEAVCNLLWVATGFVRTFESTNYLDMDSHTFQNAVGFFIDKSLNHADFYNVGIYGSSFDVKIKKKYLEALYYIFTKLEVFLAEKEELDRISRQIWLCDVWRECYLAATSYEDLNVSDPEHYRTIELFGWWSGSEADLSRFTNVETLILSEDCGNIKIQYKGDSLKKFISHCDLPWAVVSSLSLSSVEEMELRLPDPPDIIELEADNLRRISIIYTGSGNIQDLAFRFPNSLNLEEIHIQNIIDEYFEEEVIYPWEEEI